MQIMIDGKIAGSISRDEYAALQRSIVLSPIVFAKQVSNFLFFAFATQLAVLVLVPLGVFWAVVAAAVLDPDGLTRVLVSVVEFPSIFSTAMVRLISLSLPVAELVVATTVLLGISKFGFSNYVKLELHQRLKGRVGWAGRGDVTVAEHAAETPVKA